MKITDLSNLIIWKWHLLRVSLLQQCNSHAMVSNCNYRKIFSIATEGGEMHWIWGWVKLINLELMYVIYLFSLDWHYYFHFVWDKSSFFKAKREKPWKLKLWVSGIVSCPKLKTRNRTDEKSKYYCWSFNMCRIFHVVN